MEETHMEETYQILTMTYSPILGTTYELKNVMDVKHTNIPELNNNDNNKTLVGGKKVSNTNNPQQ